MNTEDPTNLPPDLLLYLHEVERGILLRALDKARGNRTKAGQLLGLSLRQMRYRMAARGITIEDWKAGLIYAYQAQVDVDRLWISGGPCEQPEKLTQNVVDPAISRW